MTARPKLTMAEKAARAYEVLRLRARGLTWREVAEGTGLGERRCREIWAEWRDREKPFLEGLEPLDYVAEQVARYEAQIEQLAEIAVLAGEEKNRSSQVGALNAQRAAMESQAELLQDTGLLPRNLGRIQVNVEARWLAMQVMGLLEDVLPPEEFEGAAERLRQIVSTAVGQRALPAVAGNGSG